MKKSEIGQRIEAIVFQINNERLDEPASIEEFLEVLDLAHGQLAGLIQHSRRTKKFIEKLNRLAKL